VECLEVNFAPPKETGWFFVTQSRHARRFRNISNTEFGKKTRNSQKMKFVGVQEPWMVIVVAWCVWHDCTFLCYLLIVSTTPTTTGRITTPGLDHLSVAVVLARHLGVGLSHRCRRSFRRSTEWCWRREAWQTIRETEFCTLCNFWKLVSDIRNTESCSSPAANQRWHKRHSVQHREAKSSGAAARPEDESCKSRLSLSLECQASSTSRVWHRSRTWLSILDSRPTICPFLSCQWPNWHCPLKPFLRSSVSWITRKCYAGARTHCVFRLLFRIVW